MQLNAEFVLQLVILTFGVFIERISSSPSTVDEFRKFRNPQIRGTRVCRQISDSHCVFGSDVCKHCLPNIVNNANSVLCCTVWVSKSTSNMLLSRLIANHFWMNSLLLTLRFALPEATDQWLIKSFKQWLVSKLLRSLLYVRILFCNKNFK